MRNIKSPRRSLSVCCYDAEEIEGERKWENLPGAPEQKTSAAVLPQSGLSTSVKATGATLQRHTELQGPKIETWQLVARYTENRPSCVAEEGSACAHNNILFLHFDLLIDWILSVY